jgi:hypothetical protein
MACISCRASTSVIFPAVARPFSASRRQWSASYVGCTTSPHLPPSSSERQIFRSVPIRNFKNGYGVFHADGPGTDDGIGGSSRIGAQEQCPARQAYHVSTGRTSYSGGRDEVRHYPTVSASAIPTLTTDRPPTINASQAISRTSDAIDLHIAALPPLPCR